MQILKAFSHIKESLGGILFAESFFFFQLLVNLASVNEFHYKYDLIMVLVGFFQTDYVWVVKSLQVGKFIYHH